MCRAVSLLEDQTSVKAYLDLLRTWMRDTLSLVAMSRASGRIVGVAVTRINSHSDKSDTYNRVQVRDDYKIRSKTRDRFGGRGKKINKCISHRFRLSRGTPWRRSWA
ncbi:uncharacterized protein LOC118647264 [Monomorium pharaonis]|uniref:uncharacterized protein LOC118647264 n=1 Tax=Monomorium pharaonis TaxID=307658 RepID=UPI001747505A|nr:uncharacterized protein LOC118647264 [Monomorium pharaonis]